MSGDEYCSVCPGCTGNHSQSRQVREPAWCVGGEGGFCERHSAPVRLASCLTRPHRNDKTACGTIGAKHSNLASAVMPMDARLKPNVRCRPHGIHRRREADAGGEMKVSCFAAMASVQIPRSSQSWSLEGHHIVGFGLNPETKIRGSGVPPSKPEIALLSSFAASAKPDFRTKPPQLNQCIMTNSLSKLPDPLVPVAKHGVPSVVKVRAAAAARAGRSQSCHCRCKWVAEAVIPNLIATVVEWGFFAFISLSD